MPEPRVWTIPDPPGPEVTLLRDRLGNRYRPRPSGTVTYWVRADGDGYEWPFGDLLVVRGPLTDATAEVADHG